MKVRLPDLADDRFDLTPMIDIVFLLIFFFMTVAKVISDENVPVELAVAPAAQVAQEDAGRRQMVTVRRDGTVFAGSRSVDLEELRAIVREGVETIPGYRVYLRADQDTPHRDVRAVMQACAEAGAFDLVFGVLQSGT